MRGPSTGKLILTDLDRTEALILLVTILNKVTQFINCLVIKAIPDNVTNCIAIIHVELLSVHAGDRPS